jgi:hypothetical protein
MEFLCAVARWFQGQARPLQARRELSQAKQKLTARGPNPKKVFSCSCLCAYFRAARPACQPAPSQLPVMVARSLISDLRRAPAIASTSRHRRKICASLAPEPEVVGLHERTFR